MIELILLGIITILVICLINKRSGNQRKTSADNHNNSSQTPVQVRINPLPQQDEKAITPKRTDPSPVSPSSLDMSSKFDDNREITEEFQRVRHLIASGEKLILVTGGAGTGKTTLIQWLQEQEVLPITNIAVVAFTGIAALVCRGKTIHSLFSLPPVTILPKTRLENISSTRNSVLINMRLLIIDEISMVRSDLMDAIDRRLRKARKNDASFGGVQVIMVGDPCQLPPVVGEKERKLFSTVPGEEVYQQWDSPWFFHAKVFSGKKMKAVLLSKTFRQLEGSADYLDHLNKMRILSLTNRNQQEVIEYFNNCCYEEGQPLQDHALSITFTNAQADAINEERLRGLRGREYQFTAAATGYFAGAKNEYTKNHFTPKLPAPYTLVLKKGAQVMLLINDADKGIVNGSLAVISTIYENDIAVILPSGREIMISPYMWTSEDYLYNEETDAIERVVDGIYRQYPLTLGWAFTAHKSQGKTLEKVNIITDRKAFASGQTYVALSRTRRIEDMRLSAPLTSNNFVIDRELYKLKDYLE